MFRFPISEPVDNGVYEGNMLDPSMCALAATFFGRLCHDDSAKVETYLRDHTVRYGTLCSGTDAPVLCVSAFVGAVTAHQKPVHAFACEKAKKKQQFLMKVFPELKLLFNDVAGLAKSDVGPPSTNVWHQSACARFMFAGFT
jgi:hypothetical protein